MATIDTQFPATRRIGVLAALAGFAARVWQEIVFLSEIRARAVLMNELVRMSDAELEARGLKREELFNLVFPTRSDV